MHNRIKILVAGALATSALFAGALPANAATAISERTGKRIQSATYSDVIQTRFTSKATCESYRATQNKTHMGKWEGGWYSSKCTSYPLQQCPPATKWQMSAVLWYQVGGAQSIPESTAPEAVTAAASC